MVVNSTTYTNHTTKENNSMNKKDILKGFTIAAIMLAIGIIIVIANDGPKGLVSSVGTAIATLGINYALCTFERRNATGSVTSIGSASYDKETGTISFYKK